VQPAHRPLHTAANCDPAWDQCRALRHRRICNRWHTLGAVLNWKIMITNGLCLFNSKALDGFHGGAVGVLMLHDGKLHGGDSFFYFIGTYSCSDGKLKGGRWSCHGRRPRPPTDETVAQLGTDSPLHEGNTFPILEPAPPREARGSDARMRGRADWRGSCSFQWRLAKFPQFSSGRLPPIATQSA